MSAASQQLFWPLLDKIPSNIATRAKNLATKMRNGRGIYFAIQAERGDDIHSRERHSRASLTTGCQVPSVRRWMAAANAISGRLFTAVVVRDEEERREEEGIDYRVANSEPGWNVTKVCREWEVRGKCARENRLSMKMLEELI